MYNAAPTQIAGNGNRLNTVTSSYGKTLTLSYDASGTAGRINAVTDGTGRSVSYSYDGAGNLASFTNRWGTPRPSRMTHDDD